MKWNWKECSCSVINSDTDIAAYWRSGDQETRLVYWSFYVGVTSQGLPGLSKERYYSEKQPVKNVGSGSKTWCKLLLSLK